jgi:signal transduction histidine kinase
MSSIEAPTLPARPHPEPADEHGHPPWSQSLMFRVVLGVLAVTALISTAVFAGIDHFVSRQFEALHEERVERVATQVREGIERELYRLGSLSRLLAQDTDLINSTYYHLYLEGERDHPVAAVARMARVFNLEAIGLWAPDRKAVAIESARGDAPVAVAPAGDLSRLREAETSLRPAREGEFWLVAQIPIEHNSNVLAWLTLAGPMASLLDALEQTHSASIQPAVDGAPAPGVVRIAVGAAGVGGISEPASGVVQLDVTAPDVVGRALAEVKRLLTVIMAVSAMLLATALAFVLRWQLKPVTMLSEYIGAVGRGEFGQRAPLPRGRGELFYLVRSFNAMSTALARLRDVERRLRHQEQLSAIGRVAARVAHDMNNPLSVIGSAATTIKRRIPADDPLAEYVALIDHHCQRCSSTVRELLEYGRPVTPRLQAVAPADTCQGILRRWQRRQSDEGLRVEFAAQDGLPEFRADPLLLEQMLDNLLDNAAHAAPGGTVTLRLGGDADGVWLEVNDSGPGFSPEARAHLFEPFFTGRRGGTGLGLASCLAIARAHEGDIQVPEGQAGTVRVVLPVAPGATADQTAMRSGR